MKRNPLKSIMMVAMTIILAAGVFTGCDQPGKSGPASTISTPVLIGIPSAEVARVTAIKQNHEDEILAKTGVVGMGVGVRYVGKNGVLDNEKASVWVFTSDRNTKDIPDEIDGVPTHIEFVGDVYALSVFPTQYRTPMWSGVSVGNDKECAAGTIGCVVTRSNKMYLLSNNHVFARENAAKIGEQIDQPGRFEMNCGPSFAVAKLSQFQNISMKRNANNVIDAAIAEINVGISPTSQAVLNSYTPTQNAQNATVGMTVKKTGRTTGLTQGTVSAINVTVSVQYSKGVARFINQVYVTPGTFSAAGDSGSLIVEASSNNPVALLFAGGSTGTFGNPIGSVLSQFGVSVVPF
jgi:hypothetical protein